MTVSGNHLRRLMRKWATGVTLVTAMDSNGPHGMTVSSFTAISLEPPLILVALERGARTHQMVEQVGRFAVAILRAEQRELAKRFAGGAGVGARLGAARAGGLGLGTGGQAARSGSPLLYYNRDYRDLVE